MFKNSITEKLWTLSPWNFSILMVFSCVLTMPARAADPSWARARQHMVEISSGPVPYQHIREALSVIQNSSDPAEVRKAYEYLPRVPVQNHDDLMALYAAAKKAEEQVPTIADVKTIDRSGHAAGELAGRLRNCTDPGLKHDIASLLAGEYISVDRESLLPIPKVTPGATMRAQLRTLRVRALMEAAGGGKNADARETLWRFIEHDKDAYFGQLAASALGKIGDPADLDRLIAMLKENPRLRLSITDFGSIVVPRVMKEVDAPGISPEAKAHLLMQLRESGSHENISSYVPLLKHADPSVAQTASEAIDRNLQSSDADMITKKFHSPSDYDRIGVIIAVGEHAWDEKYVPLLTNALLHDPNPDSREMAAQYLGLHKVKSAVPDLQLAAQNDPIARVRLSASGALERIGEAK
jgi:HEAT repeat protein